MGKLCKTIGPSGGKFTANATDAPWFKQQRKEFDQKIGTDIERKEERPEMEISPQSGSERKGCPAFIFHSNKWPQIEITLFRVNIDFQNFFTEICFRNSSKKKKTAIAFSGYVFYICIDILEPRKV